MGRMKDIAIAMMESASWANAFRYILDENAVIAFIRWARVNRLEPGRDFRVISLPAGFHGVESRLPWLN